MSSKRVRIDLEFIFKASPTIIYNFVTTPACLVRWYCNEVDITGETYAFYWQGSSEVATLVDDIEDERVRFKWDEADDEEGSQLERIGDDFDLENAHADREFQSHVAEAINKLSPIQRTLVTLYHLDEMSLLDIARVTELPEGTVKNYLFRARLKLRQALERKVGEPA